MSDSNTHPPVMMSAPGARTVIDGVTYDYFGGTGYLGLQGHPEVIEAACRAAHTLGVHSATSRSRYVSQPILNVERQAAHLFDRETSFYFASGYVANAIMVRALAPTIDRVFVDAASHYSGSESATLAKVPVHEFANRDPVDLQRQLEAHLDDGERPLVMTDGVFPSFGWVAPVDAYVEVLQNYPSPAVLIDDAHGFGTLGANGRGTLEHLGLWDAANNTLEDASDRVRLFVVGTLSKAIGGFGGILPGSRALVDAATRASHYYDGASAPPAPAAAATARALQLLAAAPEIREKLRDNVRKVRAGLRAIGIDNEDLDTPIVGFARGDAAAMRRLHQDLAAAGILVPYAEAYSGVGPEGAMRLAVFATHTDEMIERLLDTLGRLLIGG